MCESFCNARIYQETFVGVPYTLKSLYTCLVRPKLEYASCVWNPFYDVRVIEWNECKGGLFDMLCVPPYEDRCALLHLETLAKRRSIACVMFIFNVLSGRVNSPNLLSVLNFLAPQYRTRTNYFHQMNYGIHEPMWSVMWQFKDVISLFDFSPTRD
jgi:hypothetical protein